MPSERGKIILARRAAKKPRSKMIIIAPLIILLMIAGVILVLVTSPRGAAQAALEPVPTATWTNHIPTTPQVCREAMEAADRMYELGLDADHATTKATSLFVQGVQDDSVAKLQEARKINKQAQSLTKQLEKARGHYRKLSKECEA